MSVETSVKTFFGKLKSEVELLFKKAVAVEPVAAQTLAVAAPLVETLMDFSPLAADEPLFAAGVSAIQTDMATASLILKGATTTPTLSSTLNSITTNLSALETAFGVKDETTAAEVTSSVNIIKAEIEAIASATTAPAAAVAPAATETAAEPAAAEAEPATELVAEPA